jgi:hypothetical protein
MRHAHFLVLTGRLNEFPLHELIETLRGQRKTGRLLVEFKAGPCALYFREGALVEATLGTLGGLEALSLALSLQEEEAAPFNFNPLVAPPGGADAQPPADNAATFARETGAHARARVIEVEPEPATAAPSSAVRDERATTRPDSTTDAPRLDAAPAPLLGAAAEAVQPRALLPAADEGALVERLARIETAVAAQARRANVERAVYAALVILLVLTALLWRGRDTATNTGNQTAGVAGRAELSAKEDDAPAGETASSANNAGNATKKDDEKATAAPDGGRTTLAASPATAAPSGRAASATTTEATTARPNARQTDARSRQLSSTDTGPPAGKTRLAPGAAASTDTAARQPAATRAERGGGHVVQVRMIVERGRVLRAEVSNPRPGMSAYEALALRMARQRRYPEEFSGQETLRLPVGQ